MQAFPSLGGVIAQEKEEGEEAERAVRGGVGSDERWCKGAAQNLVAYQDDDGSERVQKEERSEAGLLARAIWRRGSSDSELRRRRRAWRRQWSGGALLLL
jgi:hypothetical protein